jgi:hypothetical protein
MKQDLFVRRRMEIEARALAPRSLEDLPFVRIPPPIDCHTQGHYFRGGRCVYCDRKPKV